MNNQDPIRGGHVDPNPECKPGRGGDWSSSPRARSATVSRRCLRKEGYIDDFDVIDDERQGTIRVKLKYSMSGGEKVIHALDRASKPRPPHLSCAVDDLPRILNGMGIAVVSTSKGVMSDRKARANKMLAGSCCAQ